jgi:hypothetical protein
VDKELEIIFSKLADFANARFSHVAENEDRNLEQFVKEFSPQDIVQISLVVTMYCLQSATLLKGVLPHKVRVRAVISAALTITWNSPSSEINAASELVMALSEVIWFGELMQKPKIMTEPTFDEIMLLVKLAIAAILFLVDLDHTESPINVVISISESIRNQM